MLAILHNLMHKNNGEEDYVKCMKEMAGIQWERCALHIWQEKCREVVLCKVMSHTWMEALEGISSREGRELSEKCECLRPLPICEWSQEDKGNPEILSLSFWNQQRKISVPSDTSVLGRKLYSLSVPMRKLFMSITFYKTLSCPKVYNKDFKYGN